ncbi:MAG: PAS domain-containing protein, partial [Bdellovibrionales bacterium]|nr:PAS domain-containing protein [Bdellovibrionales bacterium]
MRPNSFFWQLSVSYITLAILLVFANYSLHLNLIPFLVITGFSFLVLSFYFSRRIKNTFLQLEEVTNKIADGKFNSKLRVENPEELSSFVQSINKMSAQLKSKIENITNQKNELDAVLSCMNDGVIAVDTDIRIMSVNRAAVELLDIGENNIRGKLINEVARNSQLQNMIRNVFEKEEAFQEEVSLRKNSNKTLEVSGTALKNEANKVIGALFVLHDITE